MDRIQVVRGELACEYGHPLIAPNPPTTIAPNSLWVLAPKLCVSPALDRGPPVAPRLARGISHPSSANSARPFSTSAAEVGRGSGGRAERGSGSTGGRVAVPPVKTPVVGRAIALVPRRRVNLATAPPIPARTSMIWSPIELYRAWSPLDRRACGRSSTDSRPLSASRADIQPSAVPSEYHVSRRGEHTTVCVKR